MHCVTLRELLLFLTSLVLAAEQAKNVPDIAILQALNECGGDETQALEQLEKELDRKSFAYAPPCFCAFRGSIMN